jgi:hypothetical protein
VERFGGIPPFSETQRYVVKVLRAWHHLDSSIRIPAQALELASAKQNGPGATGADVDYWLNGGGR